MKALSKTIAALCVIVVAWVAFHQTSSLPLKYYHRFYAIQYKLLRFTPAYFVSKKDIETWIASPPEWALEQIQADFSSFPAITKDALDQAYKENFSPHNQLLRVQIKDSRVYVPREVNSGLAHYKTILAALKHLAGYGFLPDCVFVICTQDYLKPNSNQPVPILTYAKSMDLPVERDLILIPDWLNLKSWAFLSKTLKHARHKYPFETRIKKLFWRGGCADSMGHRRQLVSLSETSDVIDAKFVGAGFPARHVPIHDHLAYLYQINLDGARCAWDRFVWQLYSESVIFKGKSNQMQWFYRGVKAGTHYVEIPIETARIETTIQQFNAAPESAKKLIASAKEFSENNLQVSHMYAYLALVVRAYANRYQGDAGLEYNMVRY